MPATTRRPEAVTDGWLALLERASARGRWLALVARTPRLSDGPPVALGRRCRIRLGEAGTFRRGVGVVIGDGLSALVDGPLDIGADVYINRDANIAVYAGLTIGSGCRFGERLSIHDEDHAIDGSADYLTSAVVIGRNVWVGANVVILRGCTIGDGAVIAAGAVVRSDVPAGALAAGVPARVVRTRGDPPDTASG